MSSQTKITLVVLVLLVAVMGVYYTVMVPQDAVGVSEPDTDESAAVDVDATGDSRDAQSSEPESKTSEKAPSASSPTARPSAQSRQPAGSSSPENPESTSSHRQAQPPFPRSGGPGLLSDTVDQSLRGDRGNETTDGVDRDKKNNNDTSSQKPDEDADRQPPASSSAGAGSEASSQTSSSESRQNEKSQAPSYTTYTVKPGDTMSRIAERWFGSPNKWHLIAQANPLVDPTQMKVGQALRLPPKDAVQQNKVDEKKQNTARITYTVKPGDTLSSIALQYYNRSGQWRRIYEANRETMNNDPDTLRVGMKLIIPPPEQTAQADDE